MAAPTNVLIATDLSDWAGKAALRGADIARKFPNGQAILAYVQEQSDFDFFIQFMAGQEDFDTDTLMQETELFLKEKAKNLAEKTGVTVSTEARVGRIADEIQDIIQQTQPVALILGKHGHGYHAMPVVGNTPVKLIQGCPCPALVVHNEPDQPYRRVLIPIDFSDASKDQLAQAVALIPDAAEITAIHVCQEPAFIHGIAPEMLDKFKEHLLITANEQMDQFLQEVGKGRTIKRHIAVGDPHQDIMKYANEQNIDLLVLGKKRRNRLQEYIIGSMVHTGLNEAACDVLVTPALR